MRLRLAGTETRAQLVDALRHVSTKHRTSSNEHMRKLLIDEADELLDALEIFDAPHHN